MESTAPRRSSAGSPARCASLARSAALTAWPSGASAPGSDRRRGDGVFLLVVHDAERAVGLGVDLGLDAHVHTRFRIEPPVLDLAAAVGTGQRRVVVDPRGAD